MNKIIKLLLVSIMFLSCSTKNYLELNSIIKEKKTKTSNEYVLLPNNDWAKSFYIIEKNIEYTIGVSKEHKIIFISTIDEKFTVKGLKVNDKLPELYFDREFHYTPGWGYYIEIEKSGWFAAFDFQTKPNLESRIEGFFKSDFKGRLIHIGVESR